MWQARVYARYKHHPIDPTYETRTITIPILRMRKPRFGALPKVT